MDPLPPHLEHLFTSNDSIPNDEEATQILELCSASEGELQRLEADIKRLGEERDALWDERVKLKLKIGSHRAPISALRRFPTEILQRIFGLCLHRWAVMIPKKAPLLLGHICSEWRQIALASPELWSSVHLVIPTPVHPPDPNYFHACEVVHAAFEEWMIRSGNSALDLSIASGHHDYGGPLHEEAVFPFLRTLRACSNRWQHLRITIPSAYLSVAGFEDFAEHDLPLLETFVVDDSASTIQHQYIIPLLHVAPKIRSLSYSKLCHFDPLIRWNQLAELKFDNFESSTLSSAAFLDILSLCPNLEACTVKSYQRSNGVVSEPISTPVTLAKLESLEIHAMTDSETGVCITDVLDNLVLPNLKVLVIDNTLNPEPRSPVLSLKNLLSASSCQLQSLTFNSYNPVPVDIFLDCLHMIPSLVVLIMDDDSHRANDHFFTAPVISNLTANVSTVLEDASTVQVLLPNLEKVQFTDYPVVPIWVPLNFLGSRMLPQTTTTSVCRLKSAHVTTRRRRVRFEPEVAKLGLGDRIQVHYLGDYVNGPFHSREREENEEWYHDF